MRRVIPKTALMIMALCLSTSLWSEVKVLLTASKIVKVGGAEQKQPGEKANPGDVIEYAAQYKNTDKRPVKDVKATLPIPAGMEYLPETASPASVMASTDEISYSPV